MVAIRLSQVPQYLRVSPVFLSLNVPDEELHQFSLDIPDRCLMPNPSRIWNSDDCHHFLRTVCFWEFIELVTNSTQFLDFVLDQRNKDFCINCFPRYEVDLPELSTIRTVQLCPKIERIKTAAQMGSPALVRYLCSADESGFFNTLCVAGRTHDVHFLQYLIQNVGRSSCYFNEILHMAVLEKDLNFVSTAVAAGVSLTSAAANLAVSLGHYDCLWHLASMGCPMDAKTAVAAVENSRFDYLRLIYEVYQLGSPDWSDFFEYVLYVEPGGDHDYACFQYIISLGYECTAPTFANFVAGGRTDYALWMTHNVPNLPSALCNIVAQYGDLELLAALRAIGCEFPADICTVAATAGKVDILNYLYCEGVEAGTDAITAAAENGRFACMELLYEKRCPWEESTALAAGRAGLHCFRFVLSRGCPLAKTVPNTNTVASGCDLKTLQYLHGIQFPWDESTLLAILMSNNDDKFACLQYVLESDCSCTAAFWDSAVSHMNADLLNKLRKVKCLINNSAVASTRAVAN
uniref:Uncharacterized protein n=1 Tax=Spumella elongata TaxID=89044 RepID=A0A7S3HSI6_9STRA